jgi:hypothetical protein
MTSTTTITLRALYGCCGYGSGERCGCWCHDPTQGSNNLHVDDMDRPEVKEVLDWLAAHDFQPWPGSVEWVDDPAGTKE